jgi:hypothetical protein
MFQKTGVKLTILLVALATLLIACTATGVERAADTVAPTGGITVVGRGEAFGQPGARCYPRHRQSERCVNGCN